MTRTVLSHTLSALAAAALSLTLLGHTAAGDQRQTPKLHPSQLQWAPSLPALGVKPKSPTGLATQTGKRTPFSPPNNYDLCQNSNCN